MISRGPNPVSLMYNFLGPCPVTWGTSVPFYSEPELCFEELKDEGTAMVKW